MSSADMSYARGVVVGADFSEDDVVIVRIAVPLDIAVFKQRVVLVPEDDFDRSLPTMEDVRGILG